MRVWDPPLIPFVDFIVATTRRRSPKFSFSERFSEFSTEGTAWVEVPWTGNVPCFHPDSGSKCPGTNIESQHSRALRGQSGAGTGPGDEVKGLSYTTERMWGNFIATIHRRIGHPKKVVNSKGIPQMRWLMLVSGSVPFWTSHGKSQCFSLGNTWKYYQKWWIFPTGYVSFQFSGFRIILPATNRF